jgi:hypothetical protein
MCGTTVVTSASDTTRIKAKANTLFAHFKSHPPYNLVGLR